MSTINYTVKVADAKFTIDDAVAPKLSFRDGDTYVFDQADSSNSGHILQFSITSNNSGGAEYTTGVTKTGTPGSGGAKTTIITSGSTTDTLYYYSSGGGTYGEVFSNSGFNTSTTYNLLKPIVGAEATAEKWGPMINHSIDQISEKFTALDAIPAFDDNRIQTNIALLGFKVAVNGSLAKYDLQDQIVDEYETEAGVNTGDSTNQVYATGVSYSGTTSSTPTVTYSGQATGTYNLYTWYKWTTVGSSGSLTTDTAQDYEYIVVGGGGGGGLASGGGGGGAGGFRTGTLAVGATTISSITVGGGGGGATGGTDHGDVGSSSVFSTITSTGGGGAGSEETSHDHGLPGASGGGGARRSAGTGGASNTAYGNDGGDAFDGGGGYWGGGGGGSGAEGADGTLNQGGVGGVGENNVMGMNDADSDAFLTTGAVDAGVDAGDGYRYFAGGGGGGSGSSGNLGAGGSGGGGSGGKQSNTAATNGTGNTGGGGGGAYDFVSGTSRGGNGGSGIVIVRRLTSINTYNDLILQSSDTIAEAAPTKADMVILVEDAGTGVGAVQTHIKGWVSRYETGGTKTWTQGTLVDEGHWEGGPTGGKRILAFHDLDISAQASGTQMAYKITTHSADAEFDTRIHATSIGWR